MQGNTVLLQTDSMTKLLQKSILSNTQLRSTLQNINKHEEVLISMNSEALNTFFKNY